MIIQSCFKTSDGESIEAVGVCIRVEGRGRKCARRKFNYRWINIFPRVSSGRQAIKPDSKYIEEGGKLAVYAHYHNLCSRM